MKNHDNLSQKIIYFLVYHIVLGHLGHLKDVKNKPYVTKNNYFHIIGIHVNMFSVKLQASFGIESLKPYQLKKNLALRLY